MEKENVGMTEEGRRRSEFRSRLGDLLNHYGLDNSCGTPDFVLALFIDRILEEYERSRKTTEYLRLSPAEDR